MGRDSVVSIASTRYGLDGPGIESQWGRDSPHHPDRQCGPPKLLDNGYWVSLPEEKRSGHFVDHHPAPKLIGLRNFYTHNSVRLDFIDNLYKVKF